MGIDGKKLLADYLFQDKYSRWLPELKRRETWDETVDRSLNMHLKKFSYLSDDDKEEIRLAFEQVRQKRVLPSMRTLQFAGAAIEQSNVRGFNCCVRHIDSIRSFAEIAYLALCGCGTGLGISKKYLARLPNLVDKNDKTGTVVTYPIEDTIEGWANSLEALLMCYFRNTAYTGKKIVFDYSKIRRKGTLLKTSGGTAPGYKPLKTALTKIKKLLDEAIEEHGQHRLKSIQVADILMHFADCVVSGGIRRSASIIIFEADDEDLMNAKTSFDVARFRSSYDEVTNTQHCRVWIGKKHYDVDFNLDDTFEKYEFEENLSKNKKIYWKYIEPQRARSNNSVMLIRGKTTKEQFKDIIEKSKQWGEPGFVFVDNEDVLYNPCQPSYAQVYTPTGFSTIGDIKIGDVIWSKEGWTTVTNKWSNGEKHLYYYNTNMVLNGQNCGFLGTKEHKVVQNGEKVIVDDAYNIDVFEHESSYDDITDPTFIPTKNTYSIGIKSRIFMGVDEVFDISVDNDSHTYWSNGCDVSNCAEIGFIPVTVDGRCGVQVCNLTTINGSIIKTLEQFKDAVKAETIIGTLQASYTDFKFLNAASTELTEEEALLGCSITGIMESPEVFLNEEYLREVSSYATDVNEEWSTKLGINPAARVCCIKPEGTGSLILEVFAPGCHPVHSEKFFRRVQVTKGSKVYQHFQEHNPHMCEESVWNTNKTDDVITFPIQVEDNAIKKSDLTAVEHLEIVKKLQQNWVMGGEKNNKKNVHHNVSCTVIVKDGEWDEVIDYIYQHQDYFTAVSFLSDMGDKNYPQAPFEKVFTNEDEAKFQSLLDKMTAVDYTRLRENQDNTEHTSEAACAGGACLI